VKTNTGLVIITTILSAIQIAAGATTAFFYKSGPIGSYIAQNGLDYIVDNQGGWTFQTPGGVDFGDQKMWTSLTNINGQYWHLYLTAPNGKSLSAGLYQTVGWGQNPNGYTFTWLGNGRGGSSICWVNILEFVYDPKTNIVTNLAIDFIQSEGTSFDPSMQPSAYGSFRSNSNYSINMSSDAINLVIPEPSSFLLAGIGTCIMFIRRRR
jgi:hypothetical protein